MAKTYNRLAFWDKKLKGSQKQKGGNSVKNLRDQQKEGTT